MTKFTIFLVLFGVGGTAAYELSRETEAAPVTPSTVRAETPVALRPYMQLPGGGDSDTHPVSVFYAQRYPGWRFRSVHINNVMVVTSPTDGTPVLGEAVAIYGTGPAGQGGPERYNDPPHNRERWWQLVSSSGNEETWTSMAPGYLRLP